MLALIIIKRFYDHTFQQNIVTENVINYNNNKNIQYILHICQKQY